MVISCLFWLLDVFLGYIMNLIGQAYTTNDKGLDGLILDDTALINVIVGRHNSGKTRVLKSIGDALPKLHGIPVKKIKAQRLNSIDATLNWNHASKHLSFRIREGEDYETLLSCMKLFEPDIASISIVDNRTLFYATKNDVVEYSDWGNGFAVFFDLILQLMQTKNTVITMDDFGVYFHPSIMEDIWSIIAPILKNNGNQIFVTTMSNDLIKSLLILAKDNPSEIAVFHIGKSIIDGKMIAGRYSGDRLIELDAIDRRII